ncbi:uncharacterized protein LOC129806748 [Phlebotomus papatasi]|uniref:uncharacterized protein LOC129806748 n=1 Tax=Phlebotomus papatasi TaxID=29031 RepID=UPI002483735E|nr:uncharacterized protein LOC129806748 [Phlebotomus papatasi]
MSAKVVILFLCFLRIVLCDQQAQEQLQTDSYLSALHESHTTGAGVRSPRDDLSPGYEPVKPIYGPPTSYGPSAPVYGPPSAYGPPTGYFRHGPPKYYAVQHHRTPRDWLLDKLHFKLDLVTIGKIILKLIIFKKIVKFIAILCLLLFLPKLNMMGSSSSSSDHDNNHDHDHDYDTRINELTSFVLTSIDAFTKKEVKCPQNSGEMFCRLNRMLSTIDTKYPLKRIFRYYKSSGQSVDTDKLPLSSTLESATVDSGTEN